MARADGLHLHGLWEQSTAVGARTARALGKPYIISAHGMLEPWALRNRGFKKRIYAALVERANLEGAHCLHALTSAEADDYRSFGCPAPIAVIPNGVRVPDTFSAELFLQSYPELRHKRLLLFLSRLHPKKGLDILVEAWSALAAQWPDAHLVLAGPDFEGTRSPLEQRLSALGLTKQVSFTGMLSGELKWSAFAAAECFLLPSYSEGLSVSVLEAMGTGLPVLISDRCNLPEVKSVEAGWIIQSNVKSLTYGMREMLLNSPATNRQIGLQGSKLVRERFTWTHVAAQMSAVYNWAQGGPVPQHVDLRMN